MNNLFVNHIELPTIMNAIVAKMEDIFIKQLAVASGRISIEKPNDKMITVHIVTEMGRSLTEIEAFESQREQVNPKTERIYYIFTVNTIKQGAIRTDLIQRIIKYHVDILTKRDAIYLDREIQ